MPLLAVNNCIADKMNDFATDGNDNPALDRKRAPGDFIGIFPDIYIS